MLKVIQWGSGFTGMFGLRGLLRRDDLELVGLYVHTPGKIGRDAGEIAGGDPIGVIATDDLEAILATPADCLLFMAADPLLDDPALANGLPARHVESICRFLRAGRNVVATSPAALTYPAAAHPSVIEKLETACRAGESSFLCVGIDPGFMNDFLPLALSGFTTGIKGVLAQEMLNYGAYNVPDMLRAAGFGLPPKDDPQAGRPAGTLHTWGAAVKAIARELAVPLDDIRLVREQAVAAWDFDIPAFRVEKGMVAAHSFKVEGIVDGEPRIVVQHITRLHDDVAPHWARLKSGSGGFRIVVDASPPMVAEIAFAQTGDGPVVGGNASIDACHGTAARAVNAIPILCAAPPGIHSQFTLPLVTGRGLFRR